jgi:hypothetical protein
MGKNASALDGLSTREQEIMSRLLRMPPSQQKDAPKPKTPKGESQRRRRENEATKRQGAGQG